MWLAANSSWKGQSDKAKYEKARELKKHITKVRADYTEGMMSKDREAQQRSVAVYLIDRLALRVGMPHQGSNPGLATAQARLLRASVSD